MYPRTRNRSLADNSPRCCIKNGNCNVSSWKVNKKQIFAIWTKSKSVIYMMFTPVIKLIKRYVSSFTNVMVFGCYFFKSFIPFGCKIKKNFFSKGCCYNIPCPNQVANYNRNVVILCIKDINFAIVWRLQYVPP